ncbi:unnamed protein product, partial [Prorocentrum cordatum]
RGSARKVSLLRCLKLCFPCALRCPFTRSAAAGGPGAPSADPPCRLPAPLGGAPRPASPTPGTRAQKEVSAEQGGRTHGRRRRRRRRRTTPPLRAVPCRTGAPGRRCWPSAALPPGAATRAGSPPRPRSCGRTSQLADRALLHPEVPARAAALLCGLPRRRLGVTSRAARETGMKKVSRTVCP